MDRYAPRTTAAAWIALVFFLISICEIDYVLIYSILERIQNMSASVSVFIGVAGVVGGVYAPQSLGLLIDKVAYVIVIIMRRRLSAFPSVRYFGSCVKEKKIFKENVSDQGIFHIYFYRETNKNIEAWAHRRRTRAYLDVSIFLALSFGISVAYIVTGTAPVFTSACATIIAAASLFHAAVELRIHDAVVQAWMHETIDNIESDIAL
ncbi:hypothetical protein [Marinivivus vitaminiproducens]|uniref:hypothetical protein n=1 Tax=Marinivivus vitaminiproducens TaxID=3035935 RepID=UPI0027A2283A|nr:hypothetical protein P4R82_08860 [Geminicoccaceae bacterium SCSIO 64248]